MDAVADGADDWLGLGHKSAALLHQVLRRWVEVALDGGRPSNLAVGGTIVVLSLPLPPSLLLALPA